MSEEAACGIAGIHPKELQVVLRRERYTGVNKDVAKVNVISATKMEWWRVWEVDTSIDT